MLSGFLTARRTLSRCRCFLAANASLSFRQPNAENYSSGSFNTEFGGTSNAVFLYVLRESFRKSLISIPRVMSLNGVLLCKLFGGVGVKTALGSRPPNGAKKNIDKFAHRTA